MNSGLDRMRMAMLTRYAVILLSIIVAAIVIGPWFVPYQIDEQNARELLQAPTWAHWMGTDRLGRDLFIRVLIGGRLSLSIGFFTAIAALSIGTVYGAISAYVGGKTDHWMMRLVDVVYSLPDLLLIILLTLIAGRGPIAIFAALTMVSWVTVARIVRGEVLRLKRMEFIQAATASGSGTARIIVRHLLPLLVGPLLVTATYRIPAAILAESTLSFVGLGVPPPFASWGVLANDGWATMRFYPHLLLYPSILLILVILCLNIIGDGLQTQFKPSTSAG